MEFTFTDFRDLDNIKKVAAIHIMMLRKDRHIDLKGIAAIFARFRGPKALTNQAAMNGDTLSIEAPKRIFSEVCWHSNWKSPFLTIGTGLRILNVL